MHQPIGYYGQTFRQGVLSDHTDWDTVHRSASGQRVYVKIGNDAVPVLCSEIVWIYTEDGKMDGRCGEYVTADSKYGCCPGHEEVVRGYHLERYAMTG